MEAPETKASIMELISCAEAMPDSAVHTSSQSDLTSSKSWTIILNSGKLFASSSVTCPLFPAISQIVASAGRLAHGYTERNAEPAV